MTDKKGSAINGIVWRVGQIDKEWKLMPNSGELSFYNLAYGTYNLEFAILNSENGNPDVIRNIKFKILTPWYLSIWFRVIVIVAILASLSLLFIHLHTKQKLIKSEQVRKQTLEMSKMKMDFMANISHDLKTPISLIMAPVSNLLKTCRTQSTKAGLELIDRNVRKLNEMVRRIIEYTVSAETSLSSSGTKLKIDVNKLVGNIIENVKSNFNAKEIDLQFHSPNKHLYAFINPVSMEVIIKNLLSNALKFTNPNGKVMVSVTDIGNTIEIKVCDTGVGIPQEELPMVFSRFYKGKFNENYNPDGTGIGLDIVRQHVEDANATIDVTSQPGQGTTFTVNLPFANEGISGESISYSTSVSLSKTSVLIIDDNRDLSEYLTKVMNEMECRYASDGVEGQIMAEEWKPDIIISDLNMPNKNGMELIHSLKKNLFTQHIPIIILSARQDVNSRIEALREGASAYITKPFEIDELLITIQRLTERKNIRDLENISTDKPSDSTAVSTRKLDEIFYDRLTKTIEENIDDSNLGVKELAEKMDTNAKNLYRRVKLITGYTPVEFIRIIRLQKAALLLKEPYLTVNEVMYMVGFSTPSYFSKCFNEKYGKTPSSYRQSLLEA